MDNDDVDQDSKKHEIEEIVFDGLVNNHREYLVKWKGYAYLHEIEVALQTILQQYIHTALYEYNVEIDIEDLLPLYDAIIEDLNYRYPRAFEN